MMKHITEKKLQYLIDNWETKSTKAIAKTLKIDPALARQWASTLRKKGFNLVMKKPNRSESVVAHFTKAKTKKK
jgi:hypothetical protein